MQIPPLKKSTFWTIVAAAVLVGIITGLMISGYALFKNRAAFCQAGSATRALTLSQDQSVSGTVVSVSPSQLVLLVNAIDRYNPQTPTAVNASIALSSSDVIMRFERTGDSPVFHAASSTISEIKPGEYITVKGLAGGAKVIYLPLINQPANK